jgi:uncharacterized membrane protein YuzA (DUF378 family)
MKLKIKEFEFTIEAKTLVIIGVLILGVMGIFSSEQIFQLIMQLVQMVFIKP